MIITFVLPGAGRKPIGGYKIVYEYANRLTEKGHAIKLVHAANVERNSTFRIRFRNYIRYLKRRIRKDYGPREWFDLHPDVKLIWLPNLSSRGFPIGDVVIATSWKTAEWIVDYPSSKGARFYFLQHQETWSGVKERVMATWKLPLYKLVISHWLQDIANDLGEEAIYIPNGLNFKKFGMDQKPEQRNTSTVMMMYHLDDWKGSSDGLKALEQVRLQLPSLKVIMFGIPSPDISFPDWVTYYRQPSQKALRRLYNTAAVFIAPSWSEGWGLPGSEAMMCGAALVATDIGGHREYAKHEQNALMVPARDVDTLATQVLRLCADRHLRNQLAYAGYKSIQQFTWENSTHLLETALLSKLSEKS